MSRFRRPSRRFRGSSVLEESITDFYLQKRQEWLIRKKDTPKGGVGQEERDKMENHSAIKDLGTSGSQPQIMAYLNGALGATWILTLTGKYLANWAIPPTLCCLFWMSSSCCRQKRIEIFSLPKSGPNYEDTVSFSSVSLSLWQGSGVDLPDFPFTVMQSSFNDKWPLVYQYVSPLILLYSSAGHSSTELHIYSPSTTHYKGVDALWNILTPLQRPRTE